MIDHNHYVDEAAKRVVGLTEFNLLCSGTVMVHSGDYIAVTESGGLSPRSMREGNGAQKEGSSSGGLIHFTGDSTRCFYGCAKKMRHVAAGNVWYIAKDE